MFSRNIFVRAISVVLFLILIIVVDVQCKKNSNIPEGLQLCKKDDPELNKCLENLFETLRPKLLEGIPEVGLPALDPLIIPEVVIFKGGNGQMRAVGHDIKITGISDYKLNSIKADVDKLQVNVSIFFPFLKFEGTYDVNGRIMNLPLKGKGPMQGNATSVTCHAWLKGKMLEKDGEKYVEFTSAKVDVTMKDYGIRIDKLFQDKSLNEAINVLMNDRKSQSIQAAKPIMNKVASRMLLEMVNKIAQNFSFDEVFAQKK